MSVNGFPGFGGNNNPSYQNPHEQFSLNNPYENVNQQLDMPFANDDLNKKTVVRKNNTYYQIATVKNKKNKYNVRKFIFNDKCSKMKVRGGYLSKSKLEELFDRLGDNRFKCFAAFNLNQIEYPTKSDLLMAQSGNCNNSYGFSGFAPF